MTQRIRGPCCQERGFGTRPVVAYAATAAAVLSLRGPAAARAADVASANTVTAGLAAARGTNLALAPCRSPSSTD